MAKFSDFKPHKKHKTYLLRDLGKNGTSFGPWVEVVREDGIGLGSMLSHLVDDAIQQDLDNPLPTTGGKLKDILPE